MKKVLTYLFIACLVIPMLWSCTNDEPTPENTEGYYIEEENNMIYSNFKIPPKWTSSYVKKNITVDFYPLEGTAGKFTFTATVQFMISYNFIKMNITKAKEGELFDGRYVLRGFNSNGKPFTSEFIAVVKDKMIVSIEEIDDGAYSTFMNVEGRGLGTVAEPFIISSESDFSDMLYCLEKDASKGRSKYFKQTSDIILQGSSGTSTDGRGFAGSEFAGSYNGGGYQLSNFYWNGTGDSEKDVNIGLFKRLLNGAEIHNLILSSGTIMGVSSNGGGLAGSATGEVYLHNLTSFGTISQTGYTGDNIGTLIGLAESSKLTIDTLSFNGGVVGGGNYIGGLIGRVKDSELTVQNVKTAERSYRVDGNSHVGGITGVLTNSKFTFKNVNFIHTITTEDQGVHQFSAKESYLGGLIGKIESLSGESTVTECYVRCPLGSSNGNYVGGLFGHSVINSPLTLNKAQVSGLIDGVSDVGGMFGYIEGTSGMLSLNDNCAVEVQLQNATAISGTKSVGGVIGAVNIGKINVSGEIRVSANVSASSTDAGGFAGYANNLELNIAPFEFSETMTVSAPNRAGGIVGYLFGGNGYIYGASKFNYNNGSGIQIPSAGSFTPDVACKVSGIDKIGGVVGHMTNGSLLKYICCKAIVNGSGRYVGGIAGMASISANEKFEDLVFTGTYESAGTDSSGGIFGYLNGEGSIQDCINYAKIDGYSNAGGIVGTLNYENSSAVNIYYCVNTGDITGHGRIGGIVGSYEAETTNSHQLYLTNSANYGEINCEGNSGSGIQAYGGIVGCSPAQGLNIQSCANHGYVHGSGSYHGIGGIVGTIGYDPNGAYVNNNAHVSYCANFGQIENSGSDAHIGGIVGFLEEGFNEDEDSYLHDCYNEGAIPSEQSDDNGGIVGYVDRYSTTKRCINFGKISYGNGCMGTHKNLATYYYSSLYYLENSGKGWNAGSFTESEQDDTSTFKNFDFNSVWIMSGGRPKLRSCPFQDVSF